MFDIIIGRSINIVTYPVTVTVLTNNISYWACRRAFSLSVIMRLSVKDISVKGLFSLAHERLYKIISILSKENTKKV